MKRQIFLLIFTAILDGNLIYAQKQDSIAQEPKLRTVYITLLGVGFPECYNILKLGCQINEEWSVGARLSGYYSASGGRINFGVWQFGLQAAKYFPNSKIVLNNLSVAFEALTPGAGFDGTFSIDVYTGWEGVYRWVRPYWAVGFTFMNELEKNDHWNGREMVDKRTIYLYPGIKVGFNFNL